jgi:peptide/nickel transport system permease protein
MARFVVRRLLQMVLILWVISAITFFMFWAGPADPAQLICGKDCSPQRVQEINATYGFDDPLLEQYGRYMSGLVNPAGRTLGSEGAERHCPWPCFDQSINNGLLVWDLIKQAAWPTFWLATGAAAIWLIAGVLLGVIAALRTGTAVDRASVGASLLAVSFPTLVMGYLLIYVFIVRLQLLPFPDAGSASLLDAGPLRFVEFYLLPWLTLAFISAAIYTRMTRANMIETMGEDFIRTARAKGLSERIVVFKHGLRAALAPIVTIFGLDLGALLGGAVITESIFGIQGLGKTAIDAVLSNDLPIIMAVVLVSAAFIVVANIVVDVLYAFIDPRVRLS